MSNYFNNLKNATALNNKLKTIKGLKTIVTTNCIEVANFDDYCMEVLNLMQKNRNLHNGLSNQKIS